MGANPDNARARAGLGSLLTGLEEEIDAALGSYRAARAVPEARPTALHCSQAVKQVVEPNEILQPLQTSPAPSRSPRKPRTQRIKSCCRFF